MISLILANSTVSLLLVKTVTVIIFLLQENQNNLVIDLPTLTEIPGI